LVVDDDANLLRETKSHLEKLGYNVETAGVRIPEQSAHVFRGKPRRESGVNRASFPI
jgi:CheY-like chemotaxis protein